MSVGFRVGVALSCLRNIKCIEEKKALKSQLLDFHFDTSNERELRKN